MPSKLPKRPPNAPDVWRHEDFYRAYASLSSDETLPDGTTKKYPLECVRQNVLQLCKILDSTLMYNTKIEKSYYRTLIINTFPHDLLHATEIIDAYGLSE